MSTATERSKTFRVLFGAAELAIGFSVVFLAALCLGAYAAGYALVGVFTLAVSVEQRVFR